MCELSLVPSHKTDPIQNNKFALFLVLEVDLHFSVHNNKVKLFVLLALYLQMSRLKGSISQRVDESKNQRVI